MGKKMGIPLNYSGEVYWVYEAVPTSNGQDWGRIRRIKRRKPRQDSFVIDQYRPILGVHVWEDDGGYKL